MIIGRISIIAITLIVLFFGQLKCFAAINVLSKLEIKQDDSSYNIVLKLDNDTSINKTINSQDSITLNINSVIPADNISILYDNAILDNILIQKKKFNSTSINITGHNIAKSDIYIINSSSGILKPVYVKGVTDKSKQFLHVLNKKYFTFGVSILCLIYFVSLFVSPKKTKTLRKRKKHKLSKKAVSDTIRNLRKYSSPLVPSINYANYEKMTKNIMSVPEDLRINEKEDIYKTRKAS